MCSTYYTLLIQLTLNSLAILKVPVQGEIRLLGHLWGKKMERTYNAILMLKKKKTFGVIIIRFISFSHDSVEYIFERFPHFYP